jgi:predicted permease
VALTPASRGLEGLRARFATPLHLLTAIGAVVLLVACANLGSLLVARGEARSREMAIRMATGAGAGRLVRQLLTETLILFLMGTAAALVVAHLTLQGLAAFFAIGRNPILLDIHYDWRLAAFTASVALVAGVLTGLWPAVRTLAADPHNAMKDGEARLSGSRRSATAGRVLVAGQLALSLALLVSALLFGRTMANLRAVDPGFRDAGVLTMSIDLVLPNDVAAAARRPFHRDVLERVRALPGVGAASLSVLTPLSGRDAGRNVAVPGFEPQNEMERIVKLNHVSEDYFRTFAIRLVAGRVFTPGDVEGALKVAVINEAAARTYFAGRDPIGETITLGDTAAYQVVGVVRNHKHRDLREETARFVFVPVWQPVFGIGRITLAVSSDRPMADVTREVTAAVRSAHARTLVSDVIRVEQQIDATLVSERLLSGIAGGLAAFALLLVAVGLYGTLSYSVARRRAEIGVRIALGAAPAQVASGVLREMLAPLALGTVIGVPLALLVSRLAAKLLFGVTPLDAGTYLLSAAALAAVAGVAAWAPARRACAIEPSDALRRG